MEQVSRCLRHSDTPVAIPEGLPLVVVVSSLPERDVLPSSSLNCGHDRYQPVWRGRSPGIGLGSGSMDSGGSTLANPYSGALGDQGFADTLESLPKESGSSRTMPPWWRMSFTKEAREVQQRLWKGLATCDG